MQPPCRLPDHPTVPTAHAPRPGRPPAQAGPDRTPARGRSALLLGLALVVCGLTGPGASAAENPLQRGPEPSLQSISATTGPYATASQTVGTGNGFGGATIYYPTATDQGTFGAVAISPGYTGTWSGLAWMGPRIASQGFVVIGIDTNTPTDQPAARATQLLAALDYLTQRSTVKDRVDATRLAVAGHSMGGGGAFQAAVTRPSLRAAIGFAPYDPSNSAARNTVATLVLGGQRDTLVTPSGMLIPYYTALPASTEHAYLEISGADHLFPQSPNTLLAQATISWLKVFVDGDTRYTQFLCPLADTTGVTDYRNTCPLTPSGT